ncbi:hypothetical protein B0T26DRAFT_672385 [Lasiosphaeria miniovina]|uniref:Nephrocystin 3-like N-terminal domain-containing protein n=1 Tax=Lasiosphaeria miniovina TaxID=1954250 RepID=A0AA40B4U3_9PEZI|nr:uncharacterized protein B0T26DRAFT_672385 [Lasiosphaeria miniovina]KAK0727754.1 hypothetical protein B0T26DRAFT_672385 [Lasiosphaeria miniovina]
MGQGKDGAVALACCNHIPIIARSGEPLLIALDLEAEGDAFNPTSRIHYLGHCERTLDKIRLQVKKAGESKSNLEGIARHLKWPFSASETKDLLGELSRHKETIMIALSADSIRKLQLSLSKADNLKKTIARTLKITARIAVNDEKERILNYFMTTNPQSNLDMSIKLRHPMTGLRLTESVDFTRWLETSSSKLWLSGIPGAGNTVLAGSVIQEAFARSNEAKDVSVGFFFAIINTRIPWALPRFSAPWPLSLHGSMTMPLPFSNITMKAFILQDACRGNQMPGTSGRNVSMAIFSREITMTRLEDAFEHISIMAHAEDIKLYLLERINKSRSPGAPSMVRMCLHMIAYARPRLTMEQLRQAVSTPRLLLLVKEFLQNYPALYGSADQPSLERYFISEHVSNSLLATYCLRFLQLANFCGPPEKPGFQEEIQRTRERDMSYPFYKYAAIQWLQLAKKGLPDYTDDEDGDETLLDLTLSLFHQDKTADFVLWATELLHWLFEKMELSSLKPSRVRLRDFTLVVAALSTGFVPNKSDITALKDSFNNIHTDCDNERLETSTLALIKFLKSLENEESGWCSQLIPAVWKYALSNNFGPTRFWTSCRQSPSTLRFFQAIVKAGDVKMVKLLLGNGSPAVIALPSTYLCSSEKDKSIIVELFDHAVVERLNELPPEEEGLGVLHRLATRKDASTIVWLVKKLARKEVDVNAQPSTSTFPQKRDTPHSISQLLEITPTPLSFLTSTSRHRPAASTSSTAPSSRFSAVPAPAPPSSSRTQFSHCGSCRGERTCASCTLSLLTGGARSAARIARPRRRRRELPHYRSGPDFEGSPLGTALVFATACGSLNAVKALVRRCGVTVPGGKCEGRRDLARSLELTRSEPVPLWLLAGRFSEQRCIKWRGSGQTSRERLWSGVVQVRLKLVGKLAILPHESSLEYARKLAAVRREQLGQVVSAAGGLVYPEPLPRLHCEGDASSYPAIVGSTISDGRNSCT